MRRGLAMLEALAARPPGATPKEPSHALGLHLSTTYRLPNTLVASGYAARSAEGGLFRLGARVAFLNHGRPAAASPPPVTAPHGVVGAVSVLGPCSGLRSEEDRLIPIVLEVARAIGALLKGAAGRETLAAADRLEPEEATQSAIETALATLTQSMSRVG